MLSANAVIYELQNALNMATEYIKKQDAEIKALKEVGASSKKEVEKAIGRAL